MPPRFEDAFIQEVRARTSLVALVVRDVALKRRGREQWGCCPFHSEDTASFSVSEEKGFFHCFGCGAHGDVFEWMDRRFGLGFLDAVEELAIRAGLVPDREGRTKPLAKPIARPSREEVDEEAAKLKAWAYGIWKDCKPATGTLVEIYLASRGIVLPEIPASLRFHPNLKHSDTGLYFPAMVGYVQGPDRSFKGIHRTYLKPDGSGKANVAKAKKMAGDCFGGYLRLCAAQAEMCIAEGIETSLSVMQASEMPTWAALSEGNLGAPLPPIVKSVIICADNDTKDKNNTKRRLDHATASHAARGCRVRIAWPPVGQDFNDLLQSGRAA